MPVASQLCLGTVQLGMPYGIAGSGAQVSDAEARGIIALAWERGIRRLDTAPGYGDIEERLTDLCEGRAFEIVTKIPALPADSGADCPDFITASLDRSRERLGDAICGVLFHAASNLTRPGGDAAWAAAADWCAREGVALGVSTYGPDELAALADTHDIAMAQLPANAFDQRISANTVPPEIELTVRSVFLQGLLLVAPQEAARRLPAAAASLAKWHELCTARAVPPLEAALGVIKALPNIAFCGVGVDSREQLSQIADAWEAAIPLTAPALATDNTAVIDPRQWHTVQ